MARDLSANMVTQVTAAALTPIYLMQLTLPSGSLRFWNGIGDIDFDGNTYTGSANLITFSEITESQSIEANGVKFTLNGISSSIISTVLDSNNELQRGTVDLWMACLDSDGNIITSPFKLFSGNVDTSDIEEAGEVANISISAESKLIALKRTRVRRYTPEDQKLEYAGDKFFDFVASLQDKNLEWGKGQ
jgi:hypothetical protein